MQAILDQIQQGNLPEVQICFLITNNSRCGAVQKAQAAEIPVHHISGKTHPHAQDYEKALVDVVDQYQIDLLVLAGYMKKIPLGLLKRLPHKIINIHPALLPHFGGEGLWGHHVHEAVVAAGVRVSGPTVHFVDELYDHGLIIAQRAVALGFDDAAETVAAKVLEQEHDLYWRVIRALSRQEIQVREQRVLGDVV